MSDDLKHLARRVLDLDAQATKGPWTNSFDEDGNANDVVVWAPTQPEASDFIGNVGAWEGDRAGGVMFDLDVKNAALIAEYRTVAPALARALLAALDENARLRALQPKLALLATAYDHAAKAVPDRVLRSVLVDATKTLRDLSAALAAPPKEET